MLLAVAMLLASGLASTTDLAAAQGPAGSASTTDAAAERYCVRIELFVRSGSKQSDAAAAFLTDLAKRRPGIALEVRDVGSDAEADKRARKLLADFRIKQPGLPIVHACRQLLVGYRDDTTTGRQIEDLLTIEAFVRDGCPHCAAAKRYFDRIDDRYPGFEIRYHEIIKEPGARDRLMEFGRIHKLRLTNVPAFVLCGKMLVGYDRDETSGKQLEDLMRSACVPCGASDTRGKEQSLRRKRSIPLVLPAVAWFSLAETADESAPPTEEPPPGDEPLEEIPLEDLPLEDLPLEDVPLGDVPLDDVPVGAVHQLPSDESAGSTPKTIDLPVFGKVDVTRIGLPLFIIAVGLVDGFNPCAMWVLLFLLSILVNLKSRMRILAVAGTFVLISGLAYFAFMAAWLNVFLLVGFLRPAQIVLGLLAVIVGAIHVKDFFAFHKGISLSIPDSARPGIYARVRKIVNAENMTGALFGAAVLAVLVNVIELLCTAGLPALYTQILTLHELPPWQNYAFLALYNVAYMFDDTLMVALVVITLGRRKLQEQQGRWLKLISGLAVLVLGLILLFKPEWLV